jgi:hypothetical protein
MEEEEGVWWGKCCSNPKAMAKAQQGSFESSFLMPRNSKVACSTAPRGGSLAPNNSHEAQPSVGSQVSEEVQEAKKVEQHSRVQRFASWVTIEMHSCFGKWDAAIESRDMVDSPWAIAMVQEGLSSRAPPSTRVILLRRRCLRHPELRLASRLIAICPRNSQTPFLRRSRLQIVGRRASRHLVALPLRLRNFQNLGYIRFVFFQLTRS